jgi:uncharacterized protein YecT (DUF1311 family)
LGWALAGSAPLAGGAAIGLSAPTTVPVVTYDRSCEKKAETQVALDFCAATELKEVKAILAPLLVKEAKMDTHALVTAAQAAFVRYETNECTAEAQINTGGTIYGMVITDCEVALTVQRIQAVEEYLRGPL